MSTIVSYPYLYLIPLFISTAFSLKVFRLNEAKPLKIFSAFLCLTLAIEILAVLWKKWLHNTAFWHYSQSNLWIYNAFLLIQHLFITIYFHEILKSAWIKKMLIITLIPVLVVFIINYFFWQTPHTVNSFTILTSNLTAVTLTSLFFYQILRNEESARLKAIPEFWVCSGILIYNASSIPLFTYANSLLAYNYTVAGHFFYINDALNIVTYIIYLIAYI